MSELSDIIDALKPVSTATITTVLLKHGLRRVWMRGTRQFVPGSRALSGAHSLCASSRRARILQRPLPGPPRARRERLLRRCRRAASRWPTQWASRTPGIFGDILCARIKQRGVAGLVTDGVVRDMAGVLKTGLSVWCQGAAAPPSVAGLTFVNWQEPIGCGGVAVYPDDLVVVDDDGAVLIPAALIEDVVRVAPEQERMETWIMDEVSNGAKLPGLYPPNEENLKRYKDWASRS